MARHFKKKCEKDRHELLAATPPHEANKLLIRMARVKETGPRAAGLVPLKLMFIGVKKAHLNARLKKGVRAYIELPPEADALPGNCGRRIIRPAACGLQPALGRTTTRRSSSGQASLEACPRPLLSSVGVVE